MSKKKKTGDSKKKYKWSNMKWYSIVLIKKCKTKQQTIFTYHADKKENAKCWPVYKEKNVSLMLLARVWSSIIFQG